jgi:hypothetical protein
MKKWIGPFLSLLLIVSLIFVIGIFQDSRRTTDKKEGLQLLLAQDKQGREKEEGKDTFMIDLLRQLKQIVDGWLKSINEEIEDEDVTRFKVRFLEILRSILEWVREKIDSQLENSESGGQGGPLRQIRQRLNVFAGLG